MKSLYRIVLVLLIVSFVSAGVPAKPNEFKIVVNHIKQQYKARQIRIPFVFGLLGLGARLYTKGAVKSLKLAIFTDQDFSAAVNDRGFDKMIASSFSTEWTPMIRVYSRRDGMRTYVFAKEAGRDFQILLTTVQQENAVVLSAKLNPAQLARFIEKHQNGGSIIADLGLGGDRRGNPADTQDSDKQATSSQTIEDGENVTSPKAAAREDSISAVTSNAAEPRVKADVSIDTRLVNLNATVVNRSGQPITTLRREDFTLFENATSQNITHFAPVTEPINLVLLLDYSGSTDKKKDLIKDAARRFVESLGLDDQVAVAGFARGFNLATGFTSDRKHLTRIIRDLKVPSSGTAFYDAMWKALDLFQDTPGRRNAIVVLTDGVDNSISAPRMFQPKHPFEKLFDRIAREEVTIYPMYLDTEYETVVRRHGRDTHETYAIARKQLSEVADQTGGQVFHVGDIRDLSGVYERVARELRTIYSIAYSPTDERDPSSKQWHSIKLEVTDKDATVRTRKGYWTKP